MALLQAQLDGVWVDLPTPAPENYSTTYTNLEDSYRTANGVLVREIIRANLAKVFCGWNGLDGNQSSLLQSLYDYPNFRLRYTDNFNNRVVKTVYAGVLEGKAALMNPNDFTIKTRTGMQMNFIEV